MNEEDELIRTHIGRFGLGLRNERGQRVAQFCFDNNLTIANTMFVQHPRHVDLTERPILQPHRLHLDEALVEVVNYLLQDFNRIRMRFGPPTTNMRVLPKTKV